jgi:TRAP-type mannitol/chloroaromatic compound transport system substrate-binding protein
MLEKKAIDAAEYSMPSENFAKGYHEIARYVVYPGIHAPAWAFEGLIELETWEKLPPDIKVAMEAAARIVTHESMLKIIDADLDAVGKIMAGGRNEVIRLSDEFQAEARKAARAWATEAAAKAKAAGNPWPERVANSIFAFQDRWIANSKYLVVDHRD